MNRSGANNSLPLWIALLVVPILSLAGYLQSTDVSVQSSSERTANNIVGGDRAMVSRLGVAGKVVTTEPHAIAVDATRVPNQTPLRNETPVVSLDPEAARAAVQQVENNVYERATAIFGREPVDVEWARTYEQSLRAMFAQHQGLQRVSINSISCHTSMCRIEAFTPRDADADFFTAMFYDALVNFRAGALNAEAAITRRMEQGMTSVYVARKGHMLGFY